MPSDFGNHNGPHQMLVVIIGAPNICNQSKSRKMVSCGQWDVLRWIGSGAVVFLLWSREMLPVLRREENPLFKYFSLLVGVYFWQVACASIFVSFIISGTVDNFSQTGEFFFHEMNFIVYPQQRISLFHIWLDKKIF